MDDNKPVDVNPTPVPEPLSQMPTPTDPTADTAGLSHDLAQDPSPQHTEPFKLPIQQPSRSKRPFVWILVVVLIAAIAAGVWYFMTGSKQNTTNSVASTSPSPTVAKAPDAQAIVNAVKALQHTGTLATAAKSDATHAETSQKLYIYNAYPYQTANRKFATIPAAVSGIGTTGTPAAATADFTAFKTYLTGNGFSEVKEPQMPADPILVTSVTYASSAVVCQLEQDDYSKSIDTTMTFRQSLTSLSCADIASYDSVAKPLDPIYAGLAADAKSGVVSPDGYVPYLQNLNITDGVDGYKNASVGLAYVGAPLGVGAELLYQEPGKAWTFLKLTQDTLYCSDLSTTAIKKSFGNQTCYDTKANTEVKVSTLL